MLKFYQTFKQLSLVLVLLTISSMAVGQTTYLSDDFDDGDISGWTEGTASDWVSSTDTPINGTNSLKHNLSSVSGTSYIYAPITSADLTTEDFSWRFQLQNGAWDPSSSNKFWVYIVANETDLTSSTVDGYAVGVNLTGSTDLVTLWSVTNGAADVALITSSLDWNSSTTAGIEVTRTSLGGWELSIDSDGGFDALSSAGTASNTDYTTFSYFGLEFAYTSSRAGLLWMDDVTVEGTTPATNTMVQFSSASATVGEADGTYDLTLSIANPDGSNATSVDVALTSGDAVDINSYTTTTATFAAGSSADETVTLTISDDATYEGDETLTFTLQNPAGGNNAALGSQTTFDLTITDNDPLAEVTLPYSETFDTDLSGVYTYSVSGATKEWYYNGGDMAAEINGYNSGDVEEDWMILPVINLDNYTNEVLSFDAEYQYGTEDVNNYLKLMYSIDYTGTGDPSSATWSELSYTQPSASNAGLENSGNVDLSGISGTAVYIALKALYTAGNYRRWTIDNFSIEEQNAAMVVVESLTDFGFVTNGANSSSQNFTVSGTGLSDDITVTAPQFFEVSTDDTNFSSSVTLTQSGGTVGTTTVYVRFSPNSGLNSGKSGDITISTPGTADEVIAVTGTETGNATGVDVAEQILITEVVVIPTGGEFVEIMNTSVQDIALDNYYITDATFAGGSTYYYNIVTGTNAGGGGFGDWHAKFPEGAVILAGEVQTLALAGSDLFFAEYGINPDYELYEDGVTPDLIPDMEEAFSGSIADQGSFTNGGEFVMLYYWDGTTDLVTDVDMVMWGDTAEAVDKTGISIDGPDADAITSTYQDDLATASQAFLTPTHASGNSWQRTDFTEGAEIATGGNGVDGNNEMTEDLTNTFEELAVSPGEVPCTPPSTQATSVTFGTTDETSMVVNWTQGDGDNALVVVKQGAAVDTDPESGVAYTANTDLTLGEDLGSGNIVVYAGTSSTQTVTVTGLTQGTTYHVAVYEYNTADNCYNVDTPATGSNDTTTPNDSDSDITANGGTTSSIDYASYQTVSTLTDANSVSLFTFDINDKGTADVQSTMLTDISFSISNFENLRTVALFDGTTNVGEMSAAATLDFTGLSLEASTGTSKSVTVRATFMDVVDDEEQIQVAITSATADATGSVFAAADAGAAASDVSTTDLNAVEVTATEFAIDAPASVQLNADFAVTATAVDGNGNTDVATRDVTLSLNTGSGTLSSTSGLGSKALANGVYTWSDVQYDAVETITVDVTDGSITSTSGSIEASTVATYLEDFKNYPETGSSYVDGTFTGNDGSTWTYVQCRGDQTIDAETPMLGRDRTPSAEMTSGTISGGIGTLNFDYMQAFSTNVNLEIYVNDVLITTVTSSSEQNSIKNSGDIAVDVAGDFVLSFRNPAGGGQVNIDNVEWTSFNSTAPAITVDAGSFNGDFGPTTIGTSTASSSFDVSGENLTADITVTAPTGFEVSTDDTNFSTSVTLTQLAGSVTTTTVYARFNPASNEHFADDITLTSTDANDKTVAVSGTGLSADAVYFEGFDTCPSSSMVTYSVASNEDWDCTTSGNNGNAAYISGYGADVASDDWLITPAVDLSSATNATLTFYSWTQYQDAIYPPIELLVSTDYSGTGDPTGATWTELNPIFAPEGVGTTPSDWTESGDVDLNTYVGGSIYLAFHYTSTGKDGGGDVANWALDDILIEDRNAAPTLALNTSGFNGNFGNVVFGENSEIRSYEISGSNLTADVTVTPPAGFEISTTSDFSADIATSTSSLTLTQTSGSLGATTIYVRFVPDAADGATYSGNIMHSSTDAEDVTLAVEGTEGDVTVVDISTIRPVDANGEPTALGNTVTIRGQIIGLNSRSTGFQFVINDGTGGVVLRETSGSITSETFAEGDEVEVTGDVDFYNGTTQISNITAISKLSSGNARPSATVVTTLEETIEQELIELSNVTIVDNSQWLGASDYTGTGFNVDITFGDGSATGTLRIEDDGALHLMNYAEVFGSTTTGITLTGIGGQYDSSSPYDEGYQILVYQESDIVTQVIEPGFTVDDANFNGDFGSVAVGSASAASSYVISGSEITGDLTITIPAGFEASLTSDFSNQVGNSSLPLSITPASGTIDNVTVFVRFVPSTAGAASGNLVHEATGYTTVNLAVTGEGTEDVTGIEDDLRRNVSIYPNPVSNVLSVKVPEDLRGAEVSLINLNGGIVKKAVIDSSLNINVSDVRSGVYLLQIVHKQIAISQRVVLK